MDAALVAALVVVVWAVWQAWRVWRGRLVDRAAPLRRRGGEHREPPGPV